MELELGRWYGPSLHDLRPDGRFRTAGHHFRSCPERSSGIPASSRRTCRRSRQTSRKVAEWRRKPDQVKIQSQNEIRQRA